MLGGGPYETKICPICGDCMWNGQCENLECEYHFYPLIEEEDIEE